MPRAVQRRLTARVATVPRTPSVKSVLSIWPVTPADILAAKQCDFFPKPSHKKSKSVGVDPRRIGDRDFRHRDGLLDGTDSACSVVATNSCNQCTCETVRPKDSWVEPNQKQLDRAICSSATASLGASSFVRTNSRDRKS